MRTLYGEMYPFSYKGKKYHYYKNSLEGDVKLGEVIEVFDIDLNSSIEKVKIKLFGFVVTEVLQYRPRRERKVINSC